MRKPSTLLSAIGLLLVAVLAFFAVGFVRGGSTADARARAQSVDFVRTGVHFIRDSSVQTPPYRLPCWVFSYEDDSFGPGPCHVFVSLAGGVISEDGCKR
jgi:hypothetical protein